MSGPCRGSSRTSLGYRLRHILELSSYRLQETAAPRGEATLQGHTANSHSQRKAVSSASHWTPSLPHGSPSSGSLPSSDAVKLGRRHPEQ